MDWKENPVGNEFHFFQPLQECRYWFTTTPSLLLFLTILVKKYALYIHNINYFLLKSSIFLLITVHAFRKYKLCTECLNSMLRKECVCSKYTCYIQHLPYWTVHTLPHWASPRKPVDQCHLRFCVHHSFKCLDHRLDQLCTAINALMSIPGTEISVLHDTKTFQVVQAYIHYADFGIV